MPPHLLATKIQVFLMVSMIFSGCTINGPRSEGHRYSEDSIRAIESCAHVSSNMLFVPNQDIYYIRCCVVSIEFITDRTYTHVIEIHVDSSGLEATDPECQTENYISLFSPTDFI